METSDDRPPPPPTRAGSTHFAMGLIGMFAPIDRTLHLAPGLDLDVHHETGDGHIEAGGSLRMAYGGFDNGVGTGTAMFMISGGGRYFPTPPSVSTTGAYIGGGLALEALNLQLPAMSFQGTSGGIGAYVDGGVEFFRDHHTHVGLGARLDLPFFTVQNSQFGPPSAPTKFYYAPLSIEARLTF